MARLGNDFCLGVVKEVVAQRQDETHLIERAQAGDAVAFQQLIAAEMPRVRRFARAACSAPEDADDLAQEALLKAFLALRSYRAEARFSTWLYRIVRNCVIDHVRSAEYRRRQQQVPLQEEGESEVRIAAAGHPEEEFSREQLRVQLWEALQGLPIEYRTTVVLFDVEGFSQEEVAEVEQIPTGTVKSRLSRGRRMLRDKLKTCGVVTSRGNAGMAGTVSLSRPAS